MVRALREAAPDKIIQGMDKVSVVSDGLRKEIESLDEEFILVKDTMLDQFKVSKKEIMQFIQELHEKYRLMADKVTVANDKIIITQERILDAIKKQEDDLGKDKSEILKNISSSSRKLVVLLVVFGIISMGLGIANIVIYFMK
ncbi:MAG: hypothetical protein KKF78_03490 [Candidatus Omnitrophica bacterium]|nr:hypothetical protein [Candidatus Omnitrophota bacterium]MBU1996202.1 hypothetical protein [Candidatus Omnitrophota bacterium]